MYELNISHLILVMCSRDEEKLALEQGFKCVIGIDECGCGCLAGPVTICACYIPMHIEIKGINDSKKLTPKKRDAIYQQLITNPEVKYAIVHIESDVIDQINILQARFKGFHEAYLQLKKDVPEIDMILLDGNQSAPQFKNESVSVKTITGGDAKCICIAAASILAKVTRDHIMVQYESVFPGYGFAQHKGYYQKSQVNAIRTLGPTPIHRKTFRGVKIE